MLVELLCWRMDRRWDRRRRTVVESRVMEAGKANCRDTPPSNSPDLMRGALQRDVSLFFVLVLDEGLLGDIGDVGGFWLSLREHPFPIQRLQNSQTPASTTRPDSLWTSEA